MPHLRPHRRFLPVPTFVPDEGGSAPGSSFTSTPGSSFTSTSIFTATSACASVSALTFRFFDVACGTVGRAGGGDGGFEEDEEEDGAPSLSSSLTGGGGWGSSNSSHTFG